MIPSIRMGVLSLPINTNRPAEELNDDILYQLQKMFGHLLYSAKKSYSPETWMHAFKSFHNDLSPTDVTVQQDAYEFLQKFLERFERRLTYVQYRGDQDLVDTYGKHIDDQTQISQSSMKALFNACLGGKLCDQMVLDTMRPVLVSETDETVLTAEPSIRERLEDFVCISIDVKGVGNLEAGLLKYVEGEHIRGFEWTEGEPRADIVKRMCFAELPDTLFFHLKRFEVYFDPYRREKVNDEFTFPFHIDVFPYTKEGLSTHASPFSAPPSHSSADVERAGDYQYELGAIVVHVGSADCGHYYSIIKESSLDADCRSADHHVRQRQRQRLWFEFNDAEVKTFEESNIPSECFGGRSHNHNGGDGTLSNKNAYMLVYHRVRCLDEQEDSRLRGGPSPPEGGIMDVDEDVVSVNGHTALLTSSGPAVRRASRLAVPPHKWASHSIVQTWQRLVFEHNLSPYVQDLQTSIQVENRKLLKYCQLYSRDFISCVINLMIIVDKHSYIHSRPVQASLMLSFWDFLLRHVSRSSYPDLYELGVNEVVKMLQTWASQYEEYDCTALNDSEKSEGNGNRIDGRIGSAPEGRVNVGVEEVKVDEEGGYSLGLPMDVSGWETSVTQDMDSQYDNAAASAYPLHFPSGDEDEELKRAIALSLATPRSEPVKRGRYATDLAQSLPTVISAPKTSAALSSRLSAHILGSQRGDEISDKKYDKNVNAEDTDAMDEDSPTHKRDRSNADKYPNQGILNSIISNFSLFSSALFAPEKQVRKSTAQFVNTLHQLVTEIEVRHSLVGSPAYSTRNGNSNIDGGNDAINEELQAVEYQKTAWNLIQNQGALKILGVIFFLGELHPLCISPLHYPAPSLHFYPKNIRAYNRPVRRNRVFEGRDGSDGGTANNR